MRSINLWPTSGVIARRVEGVLVGVLSLTSFGAYFQIRLGVCGQHDCSRLEVTRLFVNLTEIYIVLGVALLITGVFLFRNEDTIEIFRLGISLTALVGTFFALAIAFGILIETARLT